MVGIISDRFSKEIKNNDNNLEEAESKIVLTI